MPKATLVGQTTITEITLAVEGHHIDIGEADDVPVTRLRLTYRDRELTAVVYDTVEDGQPSSANIHPTFIPTPDAWPDWVRSLVNQHRPA